MDPSQTHTTPSLNEEEDEWDTEGFVIPSLGIEEPGQSKSNASELERKPPYPKAKEEENIYLGPHGAPPPKSKQPELNSAGRNQRFKQKLKEAHKRVESSGGRANASMSKGSPWDWLDPHCHGSQVEVASPLSRLPDSQYTSFGLTSAQAATTCRWNLHSSDSDVF